MSARVVKDDKGRPQLEPMNVSRWLAVLSRHAGKGPVRVAISRASQRRSDGQNRYYWGVVLEDVFLGLKAQAEECGLPLPFRSKDDLHEWFKWRFLRTTAVLPGGEEIEVEGHSKWLSIEAFSTYIEQIKVWAAERALYVRQSNEEAA